MTNYKPRSHESQTAYEEFVKTNSSESFNLADETVVQEFEHWTIIENRFPYDNMAHVNHLLVSKKPLQSAHAAPNNIKEEFESIIESLVNEEFYDARIENFPQVTTVKTQYHIHLVKWHNTENN